MAVWNLMPNEKYFIENHKYQPHYFSRRKVQGPQKKVNTVLVRSLQALIMGMTVMLIWSF